ncbi:hypothetical protein D3C80_885950 [compost metagenome]
MAEHAGLEEAVGVLDHGAQADGARGGVDGVVGEVQHARAVIAGLVLQADADRGRTVAGVALILERQGLGAVEHEVDRRGGDDGRQHVAGRGTAADQVARIDPAVGHAARDRGGDPGELDVQLTGADGGVGRGHSGLGGLHGAALGVDLGLGHGLGGQQALRAGQFRLGQGQLRLALGQLGAGRGQGRLGRARVEGEQQLALAHDVAVLEVHRLDVAADARPHVDRAGRLEAAGEFVPVDHLLRQRRGHRHRRRARRRGLLPLGTAIKGGRHQDGRDRDLHRAHGRNLLGGSACLRRPSLLGEGAPVNRRRLKTEPPATCQRLMTKPYRP